MYRELKSLRVKHNVTQKQIAKILKITPESYSNKETGKFNFTLEEALKISSLFGLPIEDIFKEKIIEIKEDFK